MWVKDRQLGAGRARMEPPSNDNKQLNKTLYWISEGTSPVLFQCHCVLVVLSPKGNPSLLGRGLISTLWVNEYSQRGVQQSGVTQYSQQQTSLVPETSTSGKGLTPETPAASSSLQRHVTGFKAWMQKPNWGDLERGCICKSVKIFSRWKNMLETHCGWGIRLLKQHEKFSLEC